MWLSTRRKLNWAINWSYSWRKVPGRGSNSNERFLNEKHDGSALSLREGWPAGMQFSRALSPGCDLGSGEPGEEDIDGRAILTVERECSSCSFGLLFFASLLNVK